MENLILFLNSFLSYIVVFAVILIVGGIAIFAGITLRKRKNQKEQEEAKEEQKEQTE